MTRSLRTGSVASGGRGSGSGTRCHRRYPTYHNVIPCQANPGHFVSHEGAPQPASRSRGAEPSRVRSAARFSIPGSRLASMLRAPTPEKLASDAPTPPFDAAAARSAGEPTQRLPEGPPSTRRAGSTRPRACFSPSEPGPARVPPSRHRPARRRAPQRPFRVAQQRARRRRLGGPART